MSEGTTIEKSHFVCREDNIYPLYNVSLLIDLYDIWENKIDFKEQISVANEGIIDRIYSLFEMDRSRSCSIFAPAMIFPEQKYDSSQRTYTFIAKASRGVVVALNADEYEEGQLEKEIANIEKYHKSGTLHIAETFNRFDKSGLRGIHIPADMPIEYLIYDSFMNPNQMHMSLGEEGKKRKTCTALDVIYYLNFMDDIDTRFELMPLVSINGDIIFSPITMDRLKKDWLNGIMDFILPYEVRMNKTKQLIVEWKKSYEKQIVYDIANSFKKNKFDIIKQNFELMKLNKSHPQWLGDYDVFAVDINNKSIWIVECKVIEKVATFYDMYRQQNRFFNEHKEDEKFQRRIDYLRENADQVIQQLGCTDYIGYKVIPYMCMNKVLVSRYKKVTFPIVSYPELVEIISGATRE